MIELCAVGGYDEIGRNMTALKIDDEVFVLDMGLYLEKILEEEEQENLTNQDMMRIGAVPDDKAIKDWWGQVKVIIPSHAHLDHCIHPDSYVQLANGEIDKISNVNINTKLGCIDFNSIKYDPAFCRNKSILKSPRVLFDIKTRSKRISVTGEHKFFVLDSNLEIKEKMAKELLVGDFLITLKKIPFKGKPQLIDQSFMKDIIKKSKPSLKIIIPKKTSVSLCQFIGYILGDGNPTKKDRKKKKVYVRCTDKDVRNLEFYKGLGEKIFSIKGNITVSSRNRLSFSSPILVRFLDSISEDILNNSIKRKIPKLIHRVSNKELGGFFRGLYDAEGHVGDHSIILTSGSYDLIIVAQMLLLRFGIYSHIYEQYPNPITKNKAYQLVIYHPRSLIKFKREIGFSTRAKQISLNLLIKKVGSGVGERIEIYPITNFLKETIKIFDFKLKTIRDLGVNEHHYFNNHSASLNKLKHISKILKLRYKNLKTNKKKAKSLLDKLNKIIKSDVLFEPIRKIDKINSDVKEVIDITVPGHSNFICNGIVVHNCGAIPYLADKYKCDIIGTPFTVEVLKKLLEDKGIRIKNRIKQLNCNSSIQLTDKTKVEFLNITHSTLQTVMVVVHTIKGAIVYANDFKFDNHPVLGKKPNYERLKELGERGVFALIVDCTRADVEEKTPSEKVAREMLKDVLLGTNSKDSLVVVTTFSSHIARLRSIVDFGKKLNRDVVFLGRSLKKYVDAAEALNLVNFSKEVEILSYKNLIKKKLREIEKNGRGKYLVVCTGNQGEPDAVLSRLARDDFPFRFMNDDHVIFSCRTIPSEKNIKNREILEKRLKQKKIRIFKDIHASGHAAREDHRDLITLLKPKHLIPAHGDLKKLEAMGSLGKEMGYKLGKDLHLLKNGSRISLE